MKKIIKKAVIGYSILMQLAGTLLILGGTPSSVGYAVYKIIVGGDSGYLVSAVWLSIGLTVLGFLLQHFGETLEDHGRYALRG